MEVLVLPKAYATFFLSGKLQRNFYSWSSSSVTDSRRTKIANFETRTKRFIANLVTEFVRSSFCNSNSSDLPVLYKKFIHAFLTRQTSGELDFHFSTSNHYLWFSMLWFTSKSRRSHSCSICFNNSASSSSQPDNRMVSSAKRRLWSLSPRNPVVHSSHNVRLDSWGDRVHPCPASLCWVN